MTDEPEKKKSGASEPGDDTIRNFFRSPVFRVVLVLKIIIGSLLASYYMRDLFVPFLNYYVESGFHNPWDYFASIGHFRNFPYPPVMLYILAIFRFIFSPLLAHGTFTVTCLHFFVMRLPLLLCDIMICAILLKWFPGRSKRILLYYWCSPFVIYICYWHGQLDIIPTSLFLLALYLIGKEKYSEGMAVYGISLASKSHLWIAFPFILAYLYEKRKSTFLILRDTAISLAAYLFFVIPYIKDPNFINMVYFSGEQKRFLSLAIPMGFERLAVYLAPGAITLLWFRFVSYKKHNWDLLMLYLGIVFSVFITLSPPANGYFLWSLPFLIYFMCKDRDARPLPYYIYALCYLVFFWIGKNSDIFDAWKIISPAIAALPTPFEYLSSVIPAAPETFENLAFTAMQASLAGIILNMYLFGVKSNATYHMRSKPITLGVAGDSASGKDRFVNSLKNLLGEKKVTVIAGDDYHKWSRGHEMWKVYTHLDVQGNYLHVQQDHAIALSEGKSIMKGQYDHSTGKFTREEMVDPNQTILFQGLHSFYIEGMRKIFDLKIFLSPEENLRLFWKITRDFSERGHNPEQTIKSATEREKDRQTYIIPQMELSDIIVSWIPMEPDRLGEALKNISEKNYTNGDELRKLYPEPEKYLEIRAVNTFDFSALCSRLGQWQDLDVTSEPVDTKWQKISLKGSIPSSYITMAAQDLIPETEEFASIKKLDDGLEGCLQLIFLVCLSRKLS
jgi:uridine kinase